MSALAMILTAVMAVPGDGPERPSMEMRQELDLSGKWRGWILGSDCAGQRELDFEPWDVTDEGAGRMRYKKQGLTRHGIYKQSGDRLVICLAAPGQPRPARFQSVDGQCVLILQRIKPRK